MEFVAESKYLKISPRKVALVAKTIRGLSPNKALEKLQFIIKSASLPLTKILKSALANAQNKGQAKTEELKIKSLEVLPGPSFKRWRPTSRGRAHPYKKRTSHIKVVLEAKI